MLILNFTYPLRCLRVPPVEYHWSRRYKVSDENFRFPCQLSGFLLLGQLPGGRRPENTNQRQRNKH
jgi:hypothetical protein